MIYSNVGISNYLHFSFKVQYIYIYIIHRLLVGATTYIGATNNRGGWGAIIPARRTF